MKEEHISAFKINDTDNLPFDRQEYSKFKYGSKNLARKFGNQLFERFIEDNPNLDLQKQIVVYPAPYYYIPTPVFALKDYFISNLNEYLVLQGLNPAQEDKIHRTVTYNTDYGSMSKDEREKAISGDNFGIHKEYTKDKLLLFIDDIKITGAHESRVKQMLNNQQIFEDRVFLYFGELCTECDPKIEDELNYASIVNIYDLVPIIKDSFLFNTRNIKLLLSADLYDLSMFLKFQSDSFIRTLYRYAIGNGYHKFDGYKDSINLIKSLNKW